MQFSLVPSTRVIGGTAKAAAVLCQCERDGFYRPENSGECEILRCAAVAEMYSCKRTHYTSQLPNNANGAGIWLRGASSVFDNTLPSDENRTLMAQQTEGPYS